MCREMVINVKSLITCLKLVGGLLWKWEELRAIIEPGALGALLDRSYEQ